MMNKIEILPSIILIKLMNKQNNIIQLNII